MPPDAPNRFRTDDAEMTRHSVLALLLAMSFATAAGLLAWGPVLMDGAPHPIARPGWLPGALNVLTSLPLLALGLYMSHALRRSAWPSAVLRPWRLFFACVSALGFAALLDHGTPGSAGRVLSHLFGAASFAALLLGFLADRLSPRFGSVTACIAAVVTASAATVMWWLGETNGGAGDLRGLLFIEIMPVLLIPAGALSLRGRYTLTGDWIVMLTLYVVARFFGWADAETLAATGWISGLALMHLCTFGVAAWLAMRCFPACSPALQSLAPGFPSARIT